MGTNEPQTLLIYPFITMIFSLFILLYGRPLGTEECPKKSVVNRVASQLQKALHEKGIAFLVNHGISEEKVYIQKLMLIRCIACARIDSNNNEICHLFS